MLGKIETVPLRTIWPHEAQDFTPWLSDNLEELGEALGLELSLIGTEVSVGPYSADILAMDAGTDAYVVIENQLEKTNHDHLGKCLTYASFLDAKVIVWVASTFTEEHKKALDWLNDHTTDEVAFYGLQIQLIKIDESNPAPQLEVLSSPNTLVREATKKKESKGELSSVRIAQLAFWERFAEALKQEGSVKSIQTPRPQYWFDVALGTTGIHLSNTFNTSEGLVGVRVYIHNKQVEKWLPYFESHKEKIEKEIAAELDWNPNPENRDKVITLTTPVDVDDQESWEQTIAWLVKQTVRFRSVFGALVKDHSKTRR